MVSDPPIQTGTRAHRLTNIPHACFVQASAAEELCRIGGNEVKDKRPEESRSLWLSTKER
jgi:hypothetical protein